MKFLLFCGKKRRKEKKISTIHDYPNFVSISSIFNNSIKTKGLLQFYGIRIKKTLKNYISIS